MDRLYLNRNLDCRDQDTYNRAINFLTDIFLNHSGQLQRVKELAEKLKCLIEKISPLIEQITGTVCPCCADVCCISKHGYHNYEDLVYLSALGLKPPESEFGRKDTDPCRFLTEKGCSMERSVRPSGCNWYFCDPLLEEMEKRPDYREFDDFLQDAATLWTEMIEEFSEFASIQRYC
jgi:hypothetical protein